MQPAPLRSTRAAGPWRIGLAIVIVLTLAAALGLWHLRRDAVEVQARELGLLSLALTDEIDRGLQGAQEGLQAMGAELRDGRLPLTGSDAVQALQTSARLMPLIDALWLIDPDGRLLAASEPIALPDMTSFSPGLRDLDDGATAVSRPFTDPSAHEMSLALALRFHGPPGGTSGWILARLPASALLGAFSAASPTPDARMAVFRTDGARLAGSIVATPRLDEVGVAEVLRDLRGTQVRRFHDGTQRLIATHTLPRWGLVVLLTRNLDALLVAWWQAVWSTAFGMLLLVAIAATSIYIVQRANQRRVQAQNALEAQLARASKLEALGTLAGGVAHDFNNVLAAIVGFGEMAQDGAPARSDQARHLDKVLQAALRGKTMVERILTFGRGGARAATVFALEPVVDEVLTLLAGSLAAGIVLERRYDAPAARVLGDPTRAFEAVMNLCTNALQAMPKGGALTVAIEREHVAATRVLSHSQMASGRYVVLTVTDQGTGIASDVMERLFEPFFTTRGGAGTGLGLAVVHGVMAEFGGAIDVQSAEGHGACFTLYFPESMGAGVAAADRPEALPNGAGQVLMVIDDDPTLVSLTVEMLQGLGYEPVGYSDPEVALEALTAEPHRFAAVITDEVMPGLSGTQFSESIRLRALRMPVLLVSGYGGALLAARAVAAGVNRVLAKPVQRVELANALDELLH